LGTASPDTGKGQFFYGWVVVASCLVISTVIFGIRYSFGVFFKELEQDFEWTRAATSGLFSTYMILAALFGVLGGWALDRYGPKVVILIMGTFTGVSLLVTSLADHAWQLYLSYGFLLALGTGATYTIVMSTGSRWFSRRRGTALGIIGVGGGLGTMAMVPLAAYLVYASYRRTPNTQRGGPWPWCPGHRRRR